MAPAQCVIVCMYITSFQTETQSKPLLRRPTTEGGKRASGGQGAPPQEAKTMDLTWTTPRSPPPPPHTSHPAPSAPESHPPHRWTREGYPGQEVEGARGPARLGGPGSLPAGEGHCRSRCPRSHCCSVHLLPSHWHPMHSQRGALRNKPYMPRAVIYYHTLSVYAGFPSCYSKAINYR